MTKENSKIVIKTKKLIKKQKNKTKIHNIIGKILIILILIGGIWYIHLNQDFSNNISLLAVNENSKGEIVSGSTVNLFLEIKPGSGKIYTDTNTLEEIDTQISIINSQKIACNLFNLDCENYDFFYSFNGSAILLKGPSASSAIGILTAKTVNKENINDKTVITGSLNSGGVIGNVGGVDKKIEVAKKNNFTKVLIPTFSKYNESKHQNITVVKVIDLIEAYNNFNGKNYTLKTNELNFSEYNIQMQQLSEMMCDRSLELGKQVNKESIEENSTLDKYLKQAIKSYNSSLYAYGSGSYYSAGSFCYNSNINYRLILEAQKELNLSQRKTENSKLKSDLNLQYVILNSDDYKRKIKTINDLYVYMILTDRIEEAKEYLEQDSTAEVLKTQIINQTNSTNQTNKTQITIKLKKEKEELLSNLESQYSYGKERLYTVELWQNFMIHNGKIINLDENKLDGACTKIVYENNVKNQLLSQYNLALFNTELNEINNLAENKFENKYLCIYRGLELSGKMNTILNAVGIEAGNEEDYINQIIKLTKERLGFNSNGHFPLIPYVYYEYAKDLSYQGDYSSGMLYSNFALAYADLNFYIENEKTTKRDLFDEIMTELFNFKGLSLLFIVCMLTILGFS